MSTAGIITALLISAISVFGGIGVGFFLSVVAGSTPNRRAFCFFAGIATIIGLMMACMWLVTNGTLQ